MTVRILQVRFVDLLGQHNGSTGERGRRRGCVKLHRQFTGSVDEVRVETWCHVLQMLPRTIRFHHHSSSATAPSSCPTQQIWISLLNKLPSGAFLSFTVVILSRDRITTVVILSWTMCDRITTIVILSRYTGLSRHLQFLTPGYSGAQQLSDFQNITTE